jgi:peptide deformylase
MAIRNLTHWDDPLVRTKSKSVEKYDQRLWTLLDDMRDTLEKANGYGCAAVHVGILRRVVVVIEKDNVIELINPEVIETSKETQEVTEGSIAPAHREVKSFARKVLLYRGLTATVNRLRLKATAFWLRRYYMK